MWFRCVFAPAHLSRVRARVAQRPSKKSDKKMHAARAEIARLRTENAARFAELAAMEAQTTTMAAQTAELRRVGGALARVGGAAETLVAKLPALRRLPPAERRAAQTALQTQLLHAYHLRLCQSGLAPERVHAASVWLAERVGGGGGGGRGGAELLASVRALPFRVAARL
jgi:hypothetical protein